MATEGFGSKRSPQKTSFDASGRKMPVEGRGALQLCPRERLELSPWWRKILPVYHVVGSKDASLHPLVAVREPGALTSTRTRQREGN